MNNDDTRTRLFGNRNRKTDDVGDDLDRVRSLERQIAQVGAEIDQRVYKLYGLTEEEIKIVEG
jgi:hypothetical protein